MLLPLLMLVAFVGLLMWSEQRGTTPIPDFLMWHTVLEVVAICVSALIFTAAWVSQAHTGQRSMLWVGCGFLAVALLDLAHALSYAGMPDFFTPNDASKAIVFWLVARYVEALVLLYAVVAGGQAAAAPAGRGLRLGALASTLLLVAVVIAVVLVNPAGLPDVYRPDEGLTPFKIGAELGVILLHLLALAALLRRSRSLTEVSSRWLGLGLVALMASESFFLVYAQPDDAFNLAGHLFKVAGFLCLYRAVFIETLRAPYQALQVSHAQLQAVLEALPDPLFVLDIDGRVVRIHEGHERALRLDPTTLKGKKLTDVVSAPSARALKRVMDEAMQSGYASAEALPIEVDGDTRHYQLSVSRRELPGADRWHLLMLARDVTDRVRDIDVMRRLQVAVAQSPSTIMITDLDSKLIYANQAFERSTGYSVTEAMGASPRLLHSGKTPQRTYDSLWRSLQAGKPWRGEFINRRKDGTDYLESVLISPVVDDEGRTNSYLAIKDDITAQRRDQERIRQLLNYDQLTGLPNRELLARRFDELREQAKRLRQPLALVSLGLDRFKQVNETLGQAAGDELLVNMAQRLAELARLQHIVARYGGDEYVVVLSLTSLKELGRWLEHLAAEVRRPCQVAGQSLVLTASLGVALWPDDGDTLDILLQHASAALAQAKLLGPGRQQFYSSHLQSRSARLLQLGNALRQALPEGQLQLWYQPQLDLRHGRLAGVEALLRWHHPDLGWISPAEFIPVAESNGMIVPIGAWVLQTAVHQASQWQAEGLAPFTVAVNLSLAQFEDASLTDVIDAALDESGLDPHWLELELTESMAMADPEGFLRTVASLNARGVQLALDDFGTGYSSLSHLRRMQLHRLKIDKSFIDDMLVDDHSASIVETIILMAHKLGLETTAEGVETAAQAERLREFGCDEIQGYWYSRPLPGDALAEFARTKSAQVHDDTT